MGKFIGIDLGTTYSCVSVIEGGQPKVIANRGGYKTTPSMVAFTEDGRRLIGHLAKRQLVTNPQNTVYAAKRLIGRRYDSDVVKRAKAFYPFEIVKGPAADIRIKVEGKELSIPEISAMILQEMKSVAEEYLDEPVTEAVITVPAYFNDGQRQATKDAARIAGLDVLRMINEPTAAALAYGYSKGGANKEVIAVYDLGGGTFDISILEISDGVYEVKSTSGDTYLGGDDFDDRIIDHLAEVFLEEEGIDLRRDKMALQRLKDAAEKVKCDLSSSPKAQISLPFIASDAEGPRHLELTLTQEELEKLTLDLIEKTLTVCEKAISDAGVKIDKINEIILVGGQTRMPKVQQMVEKFFGKPPRKGVHPDEVVAIGAALQGEALMKTDSDMILLDVTPLSLGIATFGGFLTKLIERNSTIPIRKSHIFTTAADNQTSVKIHVLQGESERAAENELLGEFLLGGIRAAKRGEPEIEVTFEIDSDGIVGVSAKDLETGQEQSITVTASSGLSEEEIQWMVDSSKNYEVELKAQSEVKKACHELEKNLTKIKKSLSKADLPMNSREEIETFLENAHRAMEYGDIEQIKVFTKESGAHIGKLGA